MPFTVPQLLHGLRLELAGDEHPAAEPPDPATTVQLKIVRVPTLDAAKRSWPIQWLDETAAPWLRARFEGAAERGIRFRLLNVAEFEVVGPPSHITTHTLTSLADHALRHALLEQILPYSLAMRGHLMLHAAAARGTRGVVLLVGESGAGKSTLLAALISAGLTPWSDDALRVDLANTTARAHAGFSGLRLWPDTVAALPQSLHKDLVPQGVDKPRWCPSEYPTPQTTATLAEPPPPLRCGVLLGPEAPSPQLRHLSRRDAVVLLHQHAFGNPHLDRGALERHFTQLETVAREVPFAEIRYPRHLSTLPEVTELLRVELPILGMGSI
jgi:hypothetical protein